MEKTEKLIYNEFSKNLLNFIKTENNMIYELGMKFSNFKFPKESTICLKFLISFFEDNKSLVLKKIYITSNVSNFIFYSCLFI